MNTKIELTQEQKKTLHNSNKSEQKLLNMCFRTLGPSMQKYLPNVIDLGDIPRVFLHGNPHIDNYVRTPTGCGMVDFDRARNGPFLWDIIRFLGSIATNQKKHSKKLLRDSSVQAFLSGYKKGCSSQIMKHCMPSILHDLSKSNEHPNVRVRDTHKRWKKRIANNQLDIQDPSVVGLLSLYLKNREESFFLNHYKLVEAGFSRGSFGKKHTLYFLRPNQHYNHSKQEIIIDIVETYAEKNNQYFSHDFDHNGKRMIAAADVYAPGIEYRLGYLSSGEKHLCGREIPSLQSKLVFPVDKETENELTFYVGWQLAQGHCKSRETLDNTNLFDVLSKKLSTVLDAVNVYHSELLKCYQEITKE